MGVSFNGRTEGRDHKSAPLQGCADDKGGLESGVASGGFGRDSDNGSRGGSRSVLIQVIEGEIIPRLFLAHRHRPQQRAYAGDPKLWTEVLGGDEIFANLFLGGHTADIVGRLQALVDNGVPRQRVYVDILAPIARRLGTFWPMTTRHTVSGVERTSPSGPQTQVQKIAATSRATGVTPVL